MDEKQARQRADDINSGALTLTTMAPMSRDDILKAIRLIEQSQDSLAQVLGYWLLKNRDANSRAFGAYRYQRTTPITEDQMKASEQVLDAFSHTVNRHHFAYRVGQKRLAELRKQYDDDET
jgi:hypothetical protein